MTYHHGLTLVLIAAGPSALSACDPAPQPANPRDARILFRIERPAVKVVVKQGRTLVYEVPRPDRPQPRTPPRPADNPSGGPAQAGPPKEMARPDREPGGRFSRPEVDEFVNRLRAGATPSPLKAEPIRGPWPAPAWGIERRPDSVTVWAGAYDYEVLFEFRLSGQGRAPPHLRKGE